MRMNRASILTVLIILIQFSAGHAAEEPSDRLTVQTEKRGFFSWFKRVDTDHMSYVDQVSRNPDLSVEEKKALLRKKLGRDQAPKVPIKSN